MTPRSGRTQRCNEADARRRLQHSKQFLEVAELAAEDQRDDGSLEYGNAAATLAVLAGIAAADAACCKALGRRSRTDDHDQATSLVEQIAPDGLSAAKNLRALVALKNDAQYGFYTVGPGELTKAVRAARKLVDFADTTLRR
ncbi:MAG TPA: hypothetical protein VFQ14_03970 [Thermoleophilaceae bacterium]|nr:hypothetical protein [Thermoleophilaceae bacterium]